MILILSVNLHRSTRTNEYAGMQMFLTTNLKRDWSSSWEICLSMRQISLRERVEIAWFTRDI